MNSPKELPAVSHGSNIKPHRAPLKHSHTCSLLQLTSVLERCTQQNVALLFPSSFLLKGDTKIIFSAGGKTSEVVRLLEWLILGNALDHILLSTVQQTPCYFFHTHHLSRYFSNRVFSRAIIPSETADKTHTSNSLNGFQWSQLRDFWVFVAAVIQKDNCGIFAEFVF